MFQGCHLATACSCMCSERRDPYSVKQRLNLPHCRPGAACKSDCAVRWRAISLQPAKTVAIVLLYGFDARHTRSTDNNPFREYLRDMMLMLRLVLSLRRVGTTLPVHCTRSTSQPFGSWACRCRAHSTLDAHVGATHGTVALLPSFLHWLLPTSARFLCSTRIASCFEISTTWLCFPRLRSGSKLCGLGMSVNGNFNPE